MKRIISLGLALGTALFCLEGCSVFKDTAAFYKRWMPGGQGYGISDTQMADAVSLIRPLCRGNPESHYLLACYYQVRGRHREALEELKKVTAIEPRHAEAYDRMGVCYDALQEYSRAGEAYEISLKLDPSQSRVYNNLGYSYLLQGKFDKAIVTFTRALSLGGNDKRIHNNLGIAYGLNREYHRALEQFALATDEARAHNNLAQLYTRQSMLAEARDSYKTALGLDPSLASARKGLELCMAALDSRDADKQRLKNEGLKDGDTVIARGAAASSQRIDNAAIEVANGNGVSKMARNVGRYLGERGFHVVRLSNADSFAHKRALICYAEGHREVAKQLAVQIPGTQRIVRMTMREHPGVAVKVLLGKDLVPYRHIFKDAQS